MKRNILILLLAAVALSACGPTAAPTAAPVDSQATAQALAETMVAQTMAAMPTATSTPIPPTETPTPTLVPPTNTSETEPSATEAATQTETSSTATSLPTAINRYDRPAPLLLVNNSDYTVDLWLSGPAYFHESVKYDYTIYVPLGTYSYVAYIGKKTCYGTLFINNPDKWTLVFFNDKCNFNSP